MAKTKKSHPPQKEQEEMHICYVCGKVVAGKYEYIRTRRRSELFFHPGCIRKGRGNE